MKGVINPNDWMCRVVTILSTAYLSTHPTESRRLCHRLAFCSLMHARIMI